MYEEVQSKFPGPPEFLQTTFIHLLGWTVKLPGPPEFLKTTFIHLLGFLGMKFATVIGEDKT